MPYFCQGCGQESPKWLGRCPQCGAWNTFVEKSPHSHAVPPQELSKLAPRGFSRLPFRGSELNRVLGGGIVPGSLVLLGGEPGIGKSTLLLQLSDHLASQGEKVAYISGEESPEQLQLRAERLGVKGENLYILTETDLEAILAQLDSLSPRLVVLDSIQTVSLAGVGGGPGSLAQVRECTVQLMRWAKPRAIPVLITGHVTKDGAIAGPKALEHIVDVVLYLEGEPFSSYRILRGVKNRFGSTNEVAVLEMRGEGLVEVENPSLAFLSPHKGEAPGCAVVPTLEGTRPVLVEVQALTSPTPYGFPRRTANGVDINRLYVITAVLGKRAGLALGNQDIIVNAVGGFRISEPAADLGLALAIASSFKNRPVISGLVCCGEVGLTGELRPVPHLERRLQEAQRLGYTACLAPPLAGLAPPKGMELLPAPSLSQALKLGLAHE